MPATYTATERYRELSDRFAACRDRIEALQRRLLENPAALPIAEFDRLMDEHRAEQVRFNRLELELDGMKTSTKTAAAKERWRKQNTDRRRKLHY